MESSEYILPNHSADRVPANPESIHEILASKEAALHKLKQELDRLVNELLNGTCSSIDPGDRLLGSGAPSSR